MNKIEDALYQIRLEQLEKFDDVSVRIEDSVNKVTFYANGVAKKTIDILCFADYDPEDPDPEPDPEPEEPDPGETTVFTLDTTILNKLNYTMPSGCTGVDWGDGSSSLESGASHTYESHGTYTITAKWIFNSYDFYKSNSLDYSQLVPIINISRLASIPEGTNGSRMFYSLAVTSLDLSNFDTSNITNMSYMFSYCDNLESLDLSNFNTSNVTDMGSMFTGCSNLESIDGLNDFDTSNVTTITYMFQNCKSLTSLDLSNFDTSNVTDIYGMFYGCTSLTNVSIPLKENFPYSFQSFFTGCTSLVDFNFNCIPMASTIYYMFGYIQATDTQLSGWLNKLDLSQVENVSAFMDNRLVSGTFISNLVKAHEQTITSFAYLFDDTSITSLDLSDWNTSKITNMSSMFYSCSDLTSLNVSNFDTSNVTNMSYMFSYCNKLTSLDLSSFDISNVTNMSYMFVGCNALTNLNPPRNISSSLSLKESANLTYDSLKAIINNLVDVDTPQTLILSSTSLNLLTIEDIALASSKGWDIVS